MLGKVITRAAAVINLFLAKKQGASSKLTLCRAGSMHRLGTHDREGHLPVPITLFELEVQNSQGMLLQSTSVDYVYV